MKQLVLFSKFFISCLGVGLAAWSGLSLARAAAFHPGIVAAVGAVVGVLFIVCARYFFKPWRRVARLAAELRAGGYVDTSAQGDDLNALEQGVHFLQRQLSEHRIALSQEQALSHAVLGSMVESVLALDKGGRVLFVNRSGGELLGVDPARAAGRQLWEITRLTALHRAIEEAGHAKSELKRELVVPAASGVAGDRQVMVHIAPFSELSVEGYVAVFHDVSDLKRLEQARRDFVANISHELKTPLTAIKGYVETLLEGAEEDPAHRRRFLEKIRDRSDRLSTLVNQILHLSRIESREQALELEEVDCLAIAEQVKKRHEVSVSRKGLRCYVDSGAAGPVRVTAQSESLARACDHLLENAIQHTPEGGEIRLVVYREAGRGGIRVQDSGAGIPRTELDRIFERFYRVDKARTSDAGNVGLGLAIVRHLVKAMRGEVRVDSRIGHGSCFTLSFLLAPTDSYGS